MPRPSSRSTASIEHRGNHRTFWQRALDAEALAAVEFVRLLGAHLEAAAAERVALPVVRAQADGRRHPAGIAGDLRGRPERLDDRLGVGLVEPAPSAKASSSTSAGFAVSSTRPTDETADSGGKATSAASSVSRSESRRRSCGRSSAASPSLSAISNRPTALSWWSQIDPPCRQSGSAQI